MTFEQSVQRLEEIVKQLEDGELALDASLALFEEGVALAKRCQGMLEEASGTIERLIGDKVEPWPEGPHD
ncbi:MAG: exodeoxyribonuclease VII small subunit [Sulfobacillus sp.]